MWIVNEEKYQIPIYKEPYVDWANRSIYHYTKSHDALIDIIKNNRIRLSRADATNDSREVTYGKNTIKEWISSRNRDIELSELSEYFIFSVTDLVDDSNMWHRYAGDGSGYCIEFMNPCSITFQIVEYDNSVAHQCFDAVLYGDKTAFKMLDHLSGCPFWGKKLDLMSNYYVPRIKQKGWKMECESRLSVSKHCLEHDKIFKNGSTEYIYLGLDFDSDSIPRTEQRRTEYFKNDSKYMKWIQMSQNEKIINRPKLIKSIIVSNNICEKKLSEIKCSLDKSGYPDTDKIIKKSEIV